jgi:hypothetical protein
MIQYQLKNNFMKEWEIWMEGYAATGESAKASLFAKEEGEDFDDAVRRYFDKHPRSDYDCRKRYAPRNSDGVMPLVTTHSIWGCRLFDNESDARASFG